MLLVHSSVSTVLCQPGWFILRSFSFRSTNTLNTAISWAYGEPSSLFDTFWPSLFTASCRLSISTKSQPGGFILRSFLFQPTNTTPNTAKPSGSRSRPAVLLGLGNCISPLLESFILTALLSTSMVTFRSSLHLQTNTPNIVIP